MKKKKLQKTRNKIIERRRRKRRRGGRTGEGTQGGTGAGKKGLEEVNSGPAVSSTNACL